MTSYTSRLPIPAVHVSAGSQRRVCSRSALCGLVVASVSVAAAFALEGGCLKQLLQPTALLIVGGGTFGAVLVQYPLPMLLDALRAAWRSLSRPGRSAASHATTSSSSSDDLVQLRALAARARRDAAFSLEREAEACEDPFLAHALYLMAENRTSKDLRLILEQTADARLENEEGLAAVFDSAGGFAPTMGLMGAILGLIQVMNHLTRMDQVGQGIALAFTATIYGVSIANLLLLPIAGRIRVGAQQVQQRQRVWIEGLLAISESRSPAEMEARLCMLSGSPNHERVA